jgi:hypothetical protein
MKFQIKIALATESVIRLKLIEQGVSKEKLSLLGIFVTPLLSLIPIFFRKYTNTNKPLSFLCRTYIFK